jgi:nitrite reductase/ring-hydroxylating ferredoxin subunit
MTISDETREQAGPRPPGGGPVEFAPLYEAQAPTLTGTVEHLTGLPMPRRPDTVHDLSLRTRVRRETGPRFPFPIPNGWFVVARADELAPGEVRSLFYFGRDLVLFRTADGTPRLVDAYCPHLGAHLGAGGRVVGSTLQCPFHGWRFDGADGRCVEVPYDDVEFIPRTAAVRTYPTLERNHMIWAWHHLTGGEPFYDVPEVPEFHDDAWSPVVVRQFDVATCCQDMAENNVDTPHFLFVHGQAAVPEEEFTTDGYHKRTVGQGGAFVREGYGLGLGVLRVAGATTFLSSTTPIDTENVRVCWVFTAPRSLGEGAAAAMADQFVGGISQDFPIWENKIYKDPPVLRPSERGITEHRRWCEQFYSYPDTDAGGR